MSVKSPLRHTSRLTQDAPDNYTECTKIRIEKWEYEDSYSPGREMTYTRDEWFADASYIASVLEELLEKGNINRLIDILRDEEEGEQLGLDF